MNKENCALKLVNEIILYYDARWKKTYPSGGDALFRADGTDGRKDGHDKATSCYSLCDASITESENKKGESNQEKNKNKCIK